jgi:hypothetical protein
MNINWSKGICAIWQLEGVYWIFEYYQCGTWVSFIYLIVLNSNYSMDWLVHGRIDSRVAH